MHRTWTERTTSRVPGSSVTTMIDYGSMDVWLPLSHCITAELVALWWENMLLPWIAVNQRRVRPCSAISGKMCISPWCKNWLQPRTGYRHSRPTLYSTGDVHVDDVGDNMIIDRTSSCASNICTWHQKFFW